MSLDAIQNVVLLFSNPVWSGTSSSSETVIRNLTALDTQIAYESLFDTNLTTISTNEASTTNGILQGLLYVPTLDTDHPCSTSQYEDPVYLPRNVTQKNDLPQANYKLISIAPWYNDSCTMAYLNAVRYDPIQAFIFYRPAGDVESTEEKEKKEAWRPKGAGDGWAKKYRFPIYALPKDSGNELISTLAAYSGNLDTVPYSDNITELFDTSREDYVRVWTQMRVHNEDKETPLWEFFVITFASLVGIILLVSISLHMVQWRRRYTLGQKVKSGEVDLEAMGISRVTVPMEHIKDKFVLYTYQQDPETTTTEVLNGTDTSASKSTVDTATQSESNYTAVGTNYQPTCQVCHMEFENRISVIRQLPCFHIFHAECIEEYLHRVSCLCPLCRQSMLPEGYCPDITNGMVHKERRLHKLRGQLSDDDDEDEKSLRWRGHWTWWRRKKDLSGLSRNNAGTIPVPGSLPVEHAATAVVTAAIAAASKIAAPRTVIPTALSPGQRGTLSLMDISETIGRGRRSPGTRRREIREFAEELAERENWNSREGGVWRRAVLKVFPTIG